MGPDLLIKKTYLAAQLTYNDSGWFTEVESPNTKSNKPSPRLISFTIIYFFLHSPGWHHHQSILPTTCGNTFWITNCYSIMNCNNIFLMLLGNKLV